MEILRRFHASSFYERDGLYLAGRFRKVHHKLAGLFLFPAKTHPLHLLSLPDADALLHDGFVFLYSLPANPYSRGSHVGNRCLADGPVRVERRGGRSPLFDGKVL